MAGFRAMTDRLAQLKKVPARVAKAAAARIEELIKQEFADESNAYGNAWAPLLPQTVRRKGGDSRILKCTGALSESPSVRATSGAGIEISLASTGMFHQSGTRHMAARKILPDGSALPPSWSAAIQQAYDESMKGGE